MLAAVTTREVTLLDLTSSRPSTSASSIPIPVTSSNARCAAWSTDGVYLYVAWSHGEIFKYEKSGKSCGMVWKTDEASGLPIELIIRDKNTIFVAYDSKVVAVDLTKKRPAVELLTSSEPLVSLAFLNDASILAVCSRSALQFYDLATGSLTAIDADDILSAVHAYDPGSKNEPLAFAELVSRDCQRHQCFLACGAYLVVLSARKPQAPLKVVRVASKIIGIACSPVPKGVVVATTVSGQLCIVDVEAEQSMIRSIECGVPLKTVAVSADGLSAFAGGEDGKVLQVALHAPERLPRTIFTDKRKQAILSLSVLPRTPRSQSNLAINTSVVLNTTRSATKRDSSMRTRPLRDDNSLVSAAPTCVLHQSPTSSNMSVKDAKFKPIIGVLSPKVPRVSRLGSPAKPTQPVRSPSFTRASRDATAGGSAGRPKLRNVASSSALAGEVAPIRPASGVASGMGKVTVPPLSRPKSTASISTSIFFPPPKQAHARHDSQITRSTAWCTPRPVLPVVSDVPAILPRVYDDGNGTPSAGATPTATDDESSPPSPSPAIYKKATIGSPQIIRFEGEFRPPSVVSTSSSIFMRGLDGDVREERKAKWSSPEMDTEGESVRDEDEKTARLNPKAGQLRSSKMARMRGAMTPPCTGRAVPSVAMHISPMKSPAAGVALGEVGNTIREIMCEEHAQQREELRALHLDMVHMGRNWKNELRALMDEYVGEFKSLREENERLRRENERLRRG